MNHFTRSSITASRPSGVQPQSSWLARVGVFGDGDQKRFSLQRATQNFGIETPVSVPSIVHEVLRAPGQPLETETRVFMERRFGHDFGRVRIEAPGLSQSSLTISPANDPSEREADDQAEQVMQDSSASSRNWAPADFSRVRIHTDARAAESSRVVNARAYTVGEDIVFDTGNYAPHTEAGKKLLAHELAHTLQQSSPTGATARLQRTMGDGHDLQAPRFSGDPDLEACFDNEKFLRFGSRGPAVEKIQQALIDAGFPLPEFGVDGIFGSETQGALQRFQRAHGLDPDGILGPLTMGEMDAQFAGGSPAPVPTPTIPGPTPVPPSPAPTAESITSETVVALPTPKTRTDIGVGEKVDLTHTPGSATWTNSGGKLDKTTGPKVRLTAPDTAQTITVTAGAASIDFKVIAPNDVHMDAFPTPANPNVKHQEGHADSGIATQPFLKPDNVNFSNVSYHELNTGAVVTSPGAYSCLSGRGHCKRKSGGVCPELFMTDNVVAGKGTEAVSFDCIYSGDCQQSPPFTPGTIKFSIPWEYQVGSLGFHKFATIDQVSELAADRSTMTSEKARAKGTTTVAAKTVTLTECPDVPETP